MKTAKVIQISKEPIAILGAFIGFKAIQTIYSFAVHETPAYLSQFRLAGFIVLAIGSYYVIKGKIFAFWAMGIYLVIHLLALFLAIFIIPLNQYIVKAITIILSPILCFRGSCISSVGTSKDSTNMRTE